MLAVSLFIGLKGIMAEEYTRLFARYPDTLFPSNIFYNGHYTKHVENLTDLMFEKGPLFGLICVLIKSLSLSSQSLFIIFAFGSVFIHGIYFKRMTEFYLVAFLVYMSHEIVFKEWIQIRAGFASAMVLPAVYYLAYGRIYKFFVVTILAGLIQYVGFLIIFLYFLKNRISNKKLFLGLVAIIIISFALPVKTILTNLANIKIFPEIINVYIHWEEYNQDLTIFHPKIIQQVIVLFYIMFLHYKYKPLLPLYYHIVYNTYYLGTILFVFFSEIAIFSTRFGGLFYSVEPIMITYMAYYFKHKNPFLILIIASSLILSYYNYVHRELLEPYKMFVT